MNMYPHFESHQSYHDHISYMYVQRSHVCSIIVTRVFTVVGLFLADGDYPQRMVGLYSPLMQVNQR
jgi:hypothetical protein